MFSSAKRCFESRASMWLLAIPCALLTALPSAMLATALAPSGVALALTGDPGLARVLLPWPLGNGGASSILAVGVAGAAVFAGVALWTRLFSAAVWASDASNDPAVGAALEATAGRWRRVLLLYVEAGTALSGVIIVVLGAALASNSASRLATSSLGAVFLVAVVRAAVRILLTLAVRAVVLGDLKAHPAWRSARSLIAEERHDVAAAWMFLVALGLTVWVVGRLLTPVLQDTALDYPSSSAYSLGVQATQLLVSLPLETALMAAALALWTALYLDHTATAAAPRTKEQSGDRTVGGSSNGNRGGPGGSDPLVIKALIAVLAIVVVANGIPTVLETAFASRQLRRAENVVRREVAPSEVKARPEARPPGARRPPVGYTVRAHLAGDELEWTTHIDFTNSTGDRLTDIGIHVYPAAYTAEVRDIPFGRELLSTDLDGSFRSQAKPGSFDVEAVLVRGRKAGFSLKGTALTAELGSSLAQGDRVGITIKLHASLPRWPERFGLWDDTVLLGNWIPTVAMRRSGSWRLDAFSGVGDPFFSGVADYSVQITAEAERMIVGSGSLTSVRERGQQRKQWDFEARSSRDAAFAAAPFISGLQERVGRTTVRSWYTGDQRTAGVDDFDAAVSAVEDYSSRFGRLPQEEVEIFVTRGRLGGMEYPGLIFTASATDLLSGLPLIPELVHHVGFDVSQRRYIVGHEIAHQWWYAAVGNDQVNEPWLDEAFAEVSTRLWLREQDGDDRVWQITTGNESVPARPGVVSASTNDFSSIARYTYDVYSSGATVLLELRERIGGRRFAAILRRWYRRNYLKVGTIEEFLDTVQETAGPEAAAWLRRYE